jgi:hypothetical protein
VIQDGNVTFQVLYSPPGNSNGVVLEATAVPEPTPCVLVALGLTVAATHARRRRTLS